MRSAGLLGMHFVVGADQFRILHRGHAQENDRGVQPQNDRHSFGVVEFQRRSEGFLESQRFARRIDAANLVENQMRKISGGNRKRFENTVLNGPRGQEKHDFSRENRRRNAVEHPPVGRHFLDHPADGEADEHESDCPTENDNVPVQTEWSKAVDQEHGTQTRREINTFLERSARIAVDVGQHAGHAAQSGRKQAGRHRKTEMVSDPAQRNAGHGAARYVLFEIAHIDNRRKNFPERRQNTENCSWRKGQYRVKTRFLCETFWNNEPEPVVPDDSGDTVPGSYYVLRSMNAFDLIILTILAALTIRGVMKGMVSQIVSVGSYLVCWIVASRFAFLIAPTIPAEEPWNKVGAMIVLFVVTMIAIRFAHKILESWIKTLHLQKLNKFLGGALGLVKALLICMVLTFFSVMLSETTRQIVFESKSGFRFARLIAQTGAFIPMESCELLRSQIDSFNAKVEGKIPEESTESSIRENSLFADWNMKSENGENSVGNNASGLSDLWERGSNLLAETKSFQDDLKKETQGAVSLLDGIRRWWNGEAKAESSTEESKTSTQLVAASEEIPTRSPSATSYLNTPPKANSISIPAAGETKTSTSNSIPTSAARFMESSPQPVSVPASTSTLYRDEALFSRKTTASNQDDPLETEAISNRLAELAPLSRTENTPFVSPSPTESAAMPDNSISAGVMSIPRSSRRFYYQNGQADSSMRTSRRLLDNASTTTERGTPATRFMP